MQKQQPAETETAERPSRPPRPPLALLLLLLAFVAAVAGAEEITLVEEGWDLEPPRTLSERGWEVVDAELASPPSEWSVATAPDGPEAGGVAVQGSNVAVGYSFRPRLEEAGTFLYYPGGLEADARWTDYSLAFRFRVDSDNDMFGFAVRFTDLDNRIHFQWSADPLLPPTGRRLKRVRAGAHSVLFQDPDGAGPAFVLGRWYELRCDAYGTGIEVRIDGVLWASVTDSSTTPLLDGTVALTTTSLAGGMFDDVRVFLPVVSLGNLTVEAAVAAAEDAPVDGQFVGALFRLADEVAAGFDLQVAVALTAGGGEGGCVLTAVSVRAGGLPNPGAFLARDESGLGLVRVPAAELAPGDYYARADVECDGTNGTAVAAVTVVAEVLVGSPVPLGAGSATAVEPPPGRWAAYDVLLPAPYTGVEARLAAGGGGGGGAVELLACVLETGCGAGDATKGAAAGDALVARLPAAVEGGRTVRALVRGDTNATGLVLYVVPDPPELDAVSPDEEDTEGGGNVTLRVTNAGVNASLLSAWFGGGGSDGDDGAPCLWLESSPVDPPGKAYVCGVPPGEGSGLGVRVRHLAQTSNERPFSYLAPAVADVVPLGAPTRGGAVLEVRGRSFGFNRSVTLGGRPCPAGAADTSEPAGDGSGDSAPHRLARCEVPPGQGTALPVRLVSAADERESSEVFLFSYDAPTVERTDPTEVAPGGGDRLLVVGDNFGTDAALVSVRVGGADCRMLDLVNHTAAVCEVPPLAVAAASQPVTVAVAGQPSSGDDVFVSYLAPVVDSVTPSGGDTRGGEPLTVRGANFAGAGGVVTVGGGECDPVLLYNDSTVVCLSPPGTGVGLEARVTAGARASNASSADAFFSYFPPAVSSVDPPAVRTAGGDTIAVSGQNFGANAALAGALVLVGGRPCSPLVSYSDTLIVCVAPPGETAAVAVAVTAGGQTNEPFGGPFGYLPPAVESAGPPGGGSAGGDEISVEGDNFGLSPAVTVGGAACELADAGPGSDSHTTLVCTLPPGVGTDNEVVVEAGGQTSARAGEAPVLYRYAAPFVTEVTPLSAPTRADGPVTLVVRGTSLGAEAAAVTVGGRACEPGDVRTHTRIDCALPPGEGGAEPVVVEAGGQRSDEAAHMFVYDAPVVLSVDPPVLPTEGAAGVAVRGVNFGTAEASIGIVVGSAVCDNVTRAGDGADPHELVLCDMPAGAGAGLAVTVRVADQFSDPAPGLVSYEPPAVELVEAGGGALVAPPCEDDGAGGLRLCPKAGGFQLTVRGSGFGPPGVPVAVALLPPPDEPERPAAECANATRAAGDEHDRTLVCTVTEAAGRDRVVQVTVPNGESGAQSSADVSAPSISFAGPVLEAGTLRLASAGSGPPAAGGAPVSVELPAASAAEGDEAVVQIGGSFLRLDPDGGPPEPLAWLEGLPGSGGALVPCEVVLATSEAVSCRLPATVVGAGIRLVVDDTLQASLPSNDTLRAPLPRLVDSTLGPGEDESSSSADMTGSSSLGQAVFFGALHTGNDSSLLSAWYEQASGGGAGRVECLSAAVVSHDPASDLARLSCVTQRQPASDDGSGFRFAVSVAGQESALGSDLYRYPQAPVVESVSGCDGDANATAGCPTAGGTPLVVRGLYFSPGSSVLVGSSDCGPVEFVSAAELRCPLPAGAGFGVNVVVSSAAFFSRPAPLVSYAAPRLDAVVAGCAGGSTGLPPCPRAGNATIALRGAFFGASGALVLVGGQECTGVEHAPGDPHGEVSCTVGPGTLLSRSVSLIQRRGEASSGAAVSIDYAQCEPGTVSGGPEDIECSPCGAGSFAASAGLFACVPCAQGEVAPAPGAEACERCPAGSSTAGLDGASECVPCANGTFAAADGQARCTPCAPGQTSGAPPPGLAGVTGCERCGRGRVQPESGASFCEACQPGRFAPDDGLAECERCPAGSYSGGEGASECEPCEAGRSQPDGDRSSCAPCAPGTHAPEPGARACDACDQGRFAALNGSEECAPCDTGTAFGGTGAAACSSCAAGSFAAEPGASICDPCGQGRFAAAAGATGCEPCPSGSAFGGLGAISCGSCSPGTFASRPGQAECARCEPGSFAAAFNATLCEPCPAGRFAGESGLRECEPCPAGTETAGETGRVACTECAAGRTAPLSGLPSCLPCGAGRFEPGSGSSAPDCRECPAGRVAPEDGATACDACPDGTAAPEDAGGFECTPCVPGRAGTGGVCEPCAVNGTAAGNAGLPSCEPCPAGSAPSTGRDSCEECVAGRSAVPLDASCAPCAPGRFSGPGASSCAACALGRHSPMAGAEACAQCEAGRLAAVTGLAECDECAAGRAVSSSGATSCERCPDGFFSGEGFATCEGCPAGRASGVGENGSLASGATSCRACDAGRASPGRVADCTDCAAEFFAAEPGAAECERCPAASVAGPSRTSCTCDVGYYFSGSCVACPEGADCRSTGTTFENIEALPGYWSSGNSTAPAFYRCLQRSDCVGGGAAALACADSHTGPLCAVCVDGYYRQTSGACERCPDAGGWSAVVVAAVAAAVLLLLCLQLFVVLRSGKYDLDRVFASASAEAAAAPLDFFADEELMIGAGGKVAGDSSAAAGSTARRHPAVPALALGSIAGRSRDAEDVRGKYSDTASVSHTSDGMELAVSDSDFDARAADSDVGGGGGGGAGDDEDVALSVADVSVAEASSTVGVAPSDSDLQSDPAAAREPRMAGPMFGDDAGRGGRWAVRAAGRGGGGDSADGTGGEATPARVAGAEPLAGGGGAPASSGLRKRSRPPASAFEEPAFADPLNPDILTVAGPPRPPPNFVFKLKVFVSFLQVTTSVSRTVGSAYPTSFLRFLRAWDVINADFFLSHGSSVGCIAGFGYYERFVVTVAAPAVVLLLLALLYLAPRYAARRRMTPTAWLRVRVSFAKMALYVVFLAYPGVSAVVLRHFVCRDVDGTEYLEADMDVRCSSDRWRRYAAAAGALVLVYPLGVPLFEYLVVRHHRARLHLPVVRARLGFVYAGFRAPECHFGVADLAHKLALAGLVPFADEEARLELAMGVACLYLVALALRNPYLRREDGNLALLAQAELVLIFMAGNVLYDVPATDPLTDAEERAVSAALIALFCLVVLAFLWLACAALGLRPCRQDRRPGMRLEEAEKRATAAGDGVSATTPSTKTGRAAASASRSRGAGAGAATSDERSASAAASDLTPGSASASDSDFDI